MIKVDHISEVVNQTKQYINDRESGLIKCIITPWNKVNTSLLGGFEWGDYIVTAGMSSSGKTAFAGQFIRNLHELNIDQDICLLFFTFEMPAKKILLRDIMANNRIKRSNLLSANGDKIDVYQKEKVFNYLDSLIKKDIYFIDKPCTIEEYETICRYYYKKTKKKIIAIADHSLLFKGKSSKDERGMLVDIAEGIVKIKNEFWSTHITLSQLNRDIESAARRTPCSPLNYPDKSTLFASDSLYQCADNVIIIHRPYLLKFVGDTYGPDKLSTNKDDVYFHMIKVREGEPCILKMQADFANMQILDEINN